MKWGFSLLTSGERCEKTLWSWWSWGFFPLVLDDDYLDSGLIEYGNPYQSTRSYNVPKQTTNLIWYPLGLSIRIFLLVNQPVAVLTVSISPTNQFHEIQYGNETWQWKITKFDDFSHFKCPLSSGISVSCLMTLDPILSGELHGVLPAPECLQ